MKRPPVLLVNPNFMKPPVAPIGLDYIASAILRRGYEPVIGDLAFAEDWQAALSETITDVDPIAIGITVRNIDDAYLASQDFILEKTAGVVRHISALTDRPTILGGIGFSCAPREILEFCGATYGVFGEGEFALPLMLDRIVQGDEVTAIPGAVFRTDRGTVVVNPPKPIDLDELPTPTRKHVDTARYFSEGGQAGVETKRGCNSACIYCMEPNAKGMTVRVRPPESIAQEFGFLAEQGADVFHLCDSEFNMPPNHAHILCEVLVRWGVGARFDWYVYANPGPFDADLAMRMASAGCVGIDFGADHVDEGMLNRLGRNFNAEHLRRAVKACRDNGMAVMLDLLLGSPGETKETVARAIDFMREIKPDRVGLSCGVRVYPYTPIAHTLRARGPFEENPNLVGAVKDNENLLKPVFYVDSAVGPDINGYVASLVGGDPMFFHTDPKHVDGNYNYNDNSVLAQAIRDGKRGAYWDILRRMAGN